MKSVIIIERQKLFAESFSFLLSKISVISSIETSHTASEAMELTKQLQPDLIFTDFGLPGINGFELILALKRISMHSRIIVVSSIFDPDLVSSIIQVGADGFVSKDSNFDQIERACIAIEFGEKYISNDLASALPLLRPNPNRLIPGKSTYFLSERELDVLRLICCGLTSKDIGEQLFISPFTVKKHRSNILNKLGLKNTIALFKLAVSQGWELKGEVSVPNSNRWPD